MTIRPLLLLLCCFLGCQPRSAAPHRAAAASAGAELLQPLDSAPVVRDATVVAFWLAATDTLEGEGADQLEEFHAYTALVAPGLADDSIGFVATTADSVIVVLEGGPTRRIMLAGLDFPYGYVLVEPGFPESILTGVSSDDELLDQVDWYFGLDDGSEAGESPQVVRRRDQGGGPQRPFAMSGPSARAPGDRGWAILARSAAYRVPSTAHRPSPAARRLVRP